QTLRILTRLEKRQTIQQRESNGAIDFVEFGAEGEDLRACLNLCFRTLAGVLKYDKPIPRISDSEDLRKGYYASEAALGEQIKRSVLGKHYAKFCGDFEVVEMQIMDLADDTRHTGDGGADIVVRDEIGQILYLVQCKHTTNINNPIDAGLLEDARRVRENWRALNAVVVGVSNAKKFSPRVVEQFKQMNGRLIARDDLWRMRFTN